MDHDYATHNRRGDGGGIEPNVKRTTEILSGRLPVPEIYELVREKTVTGQVC